ncbi:MAG: hypothetical protein DME40_19090 [Verrucomicrobia bacterium]|nr:MAG: hypothetical protein DME40_19090 [Verrucomicrobiota bacterium]
MQFNAEELRERIAPLLQDNFQRFGELGAGLSIWQNGEPILDLHGGFRDTKREHPWTDDTVVLVWSATKGIGSACLLHALQENRIKIDRRVSEFWPEFGRSGKMDVTIAQMVSHNLNFEILANNFCRAAIARFLDRTTRRTQFSLRYDLRRKSRDSGGAEKPPVRLGLLPRPGYAGYAPTKNVYITLWTKRR